MKKNLDTSNVSMEMTKLKTENEMKKMRTEWLLWNVLYGNAEVVFGILLFRHFVPKTVQWRFYIFSFFFSIFIANHFIRQIIDHFPYFWLATWFLMAFHCIPLFTLSKLTSLLVRHITIEPEETLFTWSILDIEVLINVRYKK